MDFSDLGAEQKAELAGAATKVAFPLVQSGVRYYFDVKRLKKRKEFEIDLAERRSQKLQQMQQPGTGGTEAEGGMAKAVGDSAADVTASAPAPDGQVEAVPPQQRIAELRETTNCGFCHEAMDALEKADDQTARQGIEELEQYINEQERLLQQDAPRERIEARLSSLVDSWETIPRALAEHGDPPRR